MKFYIIDPNLAGYSGHYFNSDRMVFDELQRRGYECRVYGAQKSAPELAAEFDSQFVPHFKHEVFAHFGRDRLVWALEDFYAGNTLFERDLAALGDLGLGKDDVLFFPNLIQNQIFGIASWFSKLPKGRRPKIALMLRWTNHEMIYLQGRPNLNMIPLLYRYACQRFVSLSPANVLVTETEEIQNFYKQALSCDLLLLPTPYNYSDLANVSSRRCDGTLRLHFAGYPGKLKGFHLLPDIIEAVRAEHTNVHFTVQITEDLNGNNDLGNAARRLRAFDPDVVELVEGQISQERYLGLMGDADIVLLPYSPQHYRTGTSGVFAEAMALGKVVVIPDNTWMSGQFAAFEGGGAVFQEWSADAVITSTKAALAELPVLQERAAQAAPRWRNFHCAKSFVDILVSRLDTVAVPE